MTTLQLFRQNHLKQALLCFAVLCFVLSSHAATSESTQSSKQLIRNFVLQNTPHAADESIEINITQLDQNFKLPTCSTPIKPSFTKPNAPAQSTAIQLSCESIPSWNVYVPVNIKVLIDVLTTERTISSGDTITDSDITLGKHDKNRLSDGYFKDKSAILGLTAARSIQAGMPITKKYLRASKIIKKNESVNLIVKHGGIQISVLGIAKSDGYLHDTIHVINPSSKKIIDAVVTGPNRAEINY